MVHDLYLSFGLVMIVFSFAGAFVGGLIMKSYIISSKKVFKYEVQTFANMNAQFISKFQDDSLKLGQNALKIQEKIDERFEHIDYKIITLNNHIDSINSRCEKLNKLENEIVKYKKIIKRLEKK